MLKLEKMPFEAGDCWGLNGCEFEAIDTTDWLLTLSFGDDVCRILGG